MKLCNCY